MQKIYNPLETLLDRLSRETPISSEAHPFNILWNPEPLINTSLTSNDFCRRQKSLEPTVN